MQLLKKLILFFFILFFIFFTFSSSSYFHSYIIYQIHSVVEKKYFSELQLSDLHGNLLSGFKIENLIVKNSNQDIVSIKNIEFKPQYIKSIFNLKFHYRVFLENGQVDLQSIKEILASDYSESVNYMATISLKDIKFYYNGMYEIGLAKFNISNKKLNNLSLTLKNSTSDRYHDFFFEELFYNNNKIIINNSTYLSDSSKITFNADINYNDFQSSYISANLYNYRLGSKFIGKNLVLDSFLFTTNELGDLKMNITYTNDGITSQSIYNGKVQDNKFYLNLENNENKSLNDLSITGLYLIDEKYFELASDCFNCEINNIKFNLNSKFKLNQGNFYSSINIDSLIILDNYINDYEISFSSEDLSNYNFVINNYQYVLNDYKITYQHF